ncbi:hypothetical protein M513_14266 [Trichuris suis]|uniref:Uncharacterized protein n=1 Tax=Trichuris suis TaxID=68888 RepID=A0A085LIR2_9BILA|nr:hypothetical protein M513_14266 [Trichuris suis]
MRESTQKKIRLTLFVSVINIAGCANMKMLEWRMVSLEKKMEACREGVTSHLCRRGQMADQKFRCKEEDGPRQLSLPTYGVKTKGTNRVTKMISKRTTCGRVMSLVTFCTMKTEEDQQKEVNRTIERDNFHSASLSIGLINSPIECHGYDMHC